MLCLVPPQPSAACGHRVFQHGERMLGRLELAGPPPSYKPMAFTQHLHLKHLGLLQNRVWTHLWILFFAPSEVRKPIPLPNIYLGSLYHLSNFIENRQGVSHQGKCS